ncbi:MAG: hypothetical protein ABIG73_00520 [Patescibacteria group bacterium]
MNKKEKEIVKSLSLILKYIRRDILSKEHRHAEINIDCIECKFRIIEGYLDWYKDLIEWDNKPKSKNKLIFEQF